MLMLDPTDPLNLSISLGAALLLYLLVRRAHSHPLPPSPRSYPLVGHIFSIPTSNEHLGFIELGNQLKTNILSFSFLGQTTIVLNSMEDVTNLLKNRSGIYSDRCYPPMVVDPSLMDCGKTIDALGYGDRWRKCRRLIHPWLTKKACRSFHNSQKQDARLLLQRLALFERTSSEIIYTEVFAALSGTLFQSIYGYRISGRDDHLLREGMQLIQNVCEASVPANFLVNIFPALCYVPSWFPGAGWKRVAREWKEQKNKLVQDCLNKTKQEMMSGSWEPSIIASSLAEAKTLGLSTEEIDDYLSNIGITLYLAGTDTTTAAVIPVFFFAMIHFPEAQNRAQAEIDSLIGDSRLPEMEDIHQLPYTNCLIQEVLRWCPIAPLGVPHAVSEDDFYRGFLIPKGAIVIGNVWAMSRDKKIYENPEEFNPDRYLDPSVPPCPIFGFGRRECPGTHYAESSLFIMIASILAAFNIKKPANEDLAGTRPTGKMTVVFRLDEFGVIIEPRSVKHAQLVRTGA
ncbi:unnamed protein product [Rhizoctonia solani]|uniref:O-methylsterigmatocystin oxidoreductase n=1 Tax=Rhizoctonia solani TaxID=456999 RepID=A0A8H3BWE4_9AGAM|nr:unnamed protein product [Rhizoctonia solani]